jgi:hypothetical protein
VWNTLVFLLPIRCGSLAESEEFVDELHDRNKIEKIIIETDFKIVFIK